MKNKSLYNSSWPQAYESTNMSLWRSACRTVYTSVDSFIVGRICNDIRVPVSNTTWHSVFTYICQHIRNHAR